MALILNQQVESKIPIEVSGITPDELRKKSIDEIQRMPVWRGREQLELANLFAISGECKSDRRIVFEGNLTPVHGIGTGMKLGEILVEGDCGRRVGLQMSGGKIVLHGNAGDFVGVEMSGGMIRVHGNAGDGVGGNLPGSKIGMNRGTIYIQGDAGKGLGQAMRRGTIIVGGDAGELVGWNMQAGTIIVFGECGCNVGAEMKRGTIAALRGSKGHLLPSFSKGLHQPVPTMAMLGHWIDSQSFDVDTSRLRSEFQMFHGDLLHGGRGELFVQDVD